MSLGGGWGVDERWGKAAACSYRRGATGTDSPGRSRGDEGKIVEKKKKSRIKKIVGVWTEQFERGREEEFGGREGGVEAAWVQFGGVCGERRCLGGGPSAATTDDGGRIRWGGLTWGSGPEGNGGEKWGGCWRGCVAGGQGGVDKLGNGGVGGWLGGWLRGGGVCLRGGNGSLSHNQVVCFGGGVSLKSQRGGVFVCVGYGWGVWGGGCVGFFFCFVGWGWGGGVGGVGSASGVGQNCLE